LPTASGLKTSMPMAPAGIVSERFPSDTRDQKPLLDSFLAGASARAADPVRSGRVAFGGDAAGADARTSAATRETPQSATPEIFVLMGCIGALLQMD